MVGARPGNLSPHLIDSISSSLAATDGKTTTETYHAHRLICQYSSARAAKDKSDRLKQLGRANLAISTTSRITSRFRFVKTEGRKPSLNTELLAKAEKLEGIKGYLTNTKTGETAYVETSIKNPDVKEKVELLRSPGH